MSDDGFYKGKLNLIAPLLAGKDRHISILEQAQTENEIEIEELQIKVVELDQVKFNNVLLQATNDDLEEEVINLNERILELEAMVATLTTGV